MDHKLNLKKQLGCIYTSDFFSGLRITDAVWVALLAARGFSLLEIGLAKSIYYTVSLLRRQLPPRGSRLLLSVSWC